MKFAHKTQQQEAGARMKQNEWLKFQTKGKKGHGHSLVKKQGVSIFKSPDTVDGKVGVVGSGQAMTTYLAQKTKYSEAFKDKLGGSSGGDRSEEL